MNYEDNVLIKLKRNYTKDEVVRALSARLSAVRVENGKLKSYIDEKEYESKDKELKEIEELKSIINKQKRTIWDLKDLVKSKKTPAHVNRKLMELNNEVKRLRKLIK